MSSLTPGSGPDDGVAASSLDQLVAIENVVLDFEAEIADKLIYVRVSQVQAFIDDLLDSIWEAQRNPEVRPV